MKLRGFRVETSLLIGDFGYLVYYTHFYLDTGMIMDLIGINTNKHSSCINMM